MSTVNEPAWLVSKVVLFAEVIVGGWSTVNTNDWTASGLTPFDAVIWSG